MGGRGGLAGAWRWGLILVVVLCSGGCTRLGDGLSDLNHWLTGNVPLKSVVQPVAWVTFVLGPLLHVALAAFLLWLWRRHGVRGAFWLALYFLARVVVAWEPFAFNSYLNALTEEAGPFGLGKMDMLYVRSACFALMGTLAFACAAVIAAAECVHVLTDRSGGSVPRLLRWLSAAREHTRLIGCVMLVLRLAPSTLALVLYLTGP